jgi:hypothetical protein
MAFAPEKPDIQFGEEQPLGGTSVLSEWQALAPHSGLLGSIRLRHDYKRDHAVDEH